MKAIIIGLMALTLSTAVQAKRLKIKFEGRLLNYSGQELGELQGSIFWQCSKKPFFTLGGLRESVPCGNGNSPISIDKQGNFSVDTKVKYGSGRNSLQLRIGPKGADYSYELIKLPHDLKAIKKDFSTLSLYKLKAQKLEMTLLTGRDANEWLRATGKDTRTEIEFTFLDEKGKFLTRARQGNWGDAIATDLNESHVILAGDRGKHPRYSLSVSVDNWEITDHLSSANLYRVYLKGPMTYDGELPEQARVMELNDKYLD